MKTLFKYLFIIGFITLFAQNAKTTDPLNPCWDLVLPHIPEKGIYNPDTVMYDTCKCYKKPWEYPFCYYVYAKQWYFVSLPFKALFIPQAPSDTIIDKNWRDIDTNFIELRTGFSELETIFGNFFLRKVYPLADDSSTDASREFKIRFENYAKIDSVVGFLRSIHDIDETGYDIRYNIDLSTTNDYDNNKKLNIFPNPFDEILKIKADDVLLENFTINIYTLEGTLIKQIIINNYKNQNEIEIGISNLPNGVYIIKFNKGKKLFYEKFIVMR